MIARILLNAFLYSSGLNTTEEQFVPLYEKGTLNFTLKTLAHFSGIYDCFSDVGKKSDVTT